MNPESAPPPGQYAPQERVSSELSVMQPGEQVICEVKRHPIGIIAIYVAIGFILVVIAVLVFALLPNVAPNSDSGDMIGKIGAVVFLALALLSAIYGLIVTKVYWGNRWVVTSDSVTQVNQKSLFNRQSAQLGVGNIEDVTAEQNGILSHMFNYGVLKVETAGRREKFVFLYCPNPNFYAKQILQVREAYEMAMHGRESEAQMPPAAPVVNQPPVPPAASPPVQPPARSDSGQPTNFRSNY